MQVANCQVFALIVVVGLLMFFSSFLTLDLHTSVSEMKKLPGHEFFHLPRMVPRDPGRSPTDPPQAASAVDKPTVVLPGETVEPNTGKVVQSEKACSITFQQKCRINPLVKYWDEVMECYTSPLRQYIGLDAPLQDRKYVVFQPDSGGWNNIRMALEVVILFAQVTGRILVLPPNAVLYLLHMNKKWGDNKSGMEDYFDFDKLRASGGLQTMPMSAFLEEVAKSGLLAKPLPNNDVNLLRQPLWDYLNSACYTRSWSPGKLYLGMNISMLTTDMTADPRISSEKVQPENFVGTFESTDPARLEEFSLKKKRELLPYDQAMHAQRAIYFSGAEPNRLLTHFYSMLFFATPLEEHRAKRFMRDRLRYHDQIFCTGSEIIEKLLKLQALLLLHLPETPSTGTGVDAAVVNARVAAEILQLVEHGKQDTHAVSAHDHGAGAEGEEVERESEVGRGLEQEDVRSGRVLPQYVAFHIRRGDFQQKHTRLPAEQIVELTNHLVEDKHKKVAYISTDEGNRSFFEPFIRTYGAVYFLGDLKNGTNIDEINQNYVGMIEQVVCANADVFIGTPLSTFTAYITRMRGFMNRTITHFPSAVETQSIANTAGRTRHTVRRPAALVDRAGLYNRTYYFMNHHMYQLHTKPHVHFPLWIRDFVDAFENIDDDSE